MYQTTFVQSIIVPTSPCSSATLLLLDATPDITTSCALLQTTPAEHSVKSCIKYCKYNYTSIYYLGATLEDGASSSY